MRYRVGHAPDADLAFMARCRAFVPTGTSGFAQLVAAVAEQLGGTVLLPRVNDTPVWRANHFALERWTYEGNVVCGRDHARCQYSP